MTNYLSPAKRAEKINARTRFRYGQKVSYKPGVGTYGYEDIVGLDGRVSATVIGLTPTRVRIRIDCGEFGGIQVRAVDASSLNHVDTHGEGKLSVAVNAVELGCPGHLIVSASCRWKRHTQIGLYRVSSIGDYWPPQATRRDTIGAADDAFFETMVFRTSGTPEQGSEGCGCLAVISYDHIECERYATAGEAQAGHERYVAKYLAIVNP